MRLRALCFAKSRWAVLKLTCGLVTQEYWWQASAAVSCVSELCDIIEKCNLLLQQPAASPARHCFYGIDLDFSFQLFLCDFNIKIYSIFYEKILDHSAMSRLMRWCCCSTPPASSATSTTSSTGCRQMASRTLPSATAPATQTRSAASNSMTGTDRFKVHKPSQTSANLLKFSLDWGCIIMVWFA